jgi:hypothetical protein
MLGLAPRLIRSITSRLVICRCLHDFIGGRDSFAIVTREVHPAQVAGPGPDAMHQALGTRRRIRRSWRDGIDYLADPARCHVQGRGDTDLADPGVLADHREHGREVSSGTGGHEVRPSQQAARKYQRRT